MTLTMTPTLIAIAAAYVVMGVLLLSVGLTARFAWWVKAVTITIASVFFIEVFFASKGLLGWPATGATLPSRFQLLWSRVVEPDVKMGAKGAIYLWVEEVDENNVPSGLPRSYRLPYSLKLAERTLKARDEIMAGNPQEGTSEDMTGDQQQNASADNRLNPQDQDGGTASTSAGQLNLDDILAQIPRVEFRPMTGPTLPPKP
jgi:hypothetical protein